jgi:DNA-binding response OmpR family regulator
VSEARPAADAAHGRNAGKGNLKVSDAVRVLVVEDEALICSLIEDALVESGFEAYSVNSGEAALSTFRDGREGCRALLTDVNLGDGISGWELARQIREITPGFPVVYMTSASAPDWKSQGVADSVLLEKPFAPAQLAAAVSQLLDTGASPG